MPKHNFSLNSLPTHCQLTPHSLPTHSPLHTEDERPTPTTCNATLQQEAVRRKAFLAEKWRRRIKGCKSTGRAAIPIWKNLLNVRRMVLSEREDLDTWLEFAALCRHGGNLDLAERVLRMSQPKGAQISLGTYSPYIATSPYPYNGEKSFCENGDRMEQKGGSGVVVLGSNDSNSNLSAALSSNSGGSFSSSSSGSRSSSRNSNMTQEERLKWEEDSSRTQAFETNPYFTHSPSFTPSSLADCKIRFAVLRQRWSVGLKVEATTCLESLIEALTTVAFDLKPGGVSSGTSILSSSADSLATSCSGQVL